MSAENLTTEPQREFTVGDRVKFVTTRSTSRSGFRFSTKEGEIIRFTKSGDALIRYRGTIHAREISEISHVTEPSPLTALVKDLSASVANPTS